MPHGRSWKVLKPNLFESLVMPLFFEYSNYHSFNRLVNAWSFRRISSGRDRGSYYHEVSVFIAIFLLDSSLAHKSHFAAPQLSAISPWKASFAKLHASASKDSQETTYEEGR